MDDISSLVERLRRIKQDSEEGVWLHEHPKKILGEAADALEWLLYKQRKAWETAEIRRLREALESIAKNTCCDGCQEAALVARAALRDATG